MIFIWLSPQSSCTINLKTYSNWFQIGTKSFFSKYTFIHETHIFQIDSNSIEYSATDRKSYLQIKYSIGKYTVFMYKMIGKCGQNRDFTKFRSAPKNQTLNTTENGFGGVERTVWTSFGCNMEVWTPTYTKTLSPLATSWFWVFFRPIFNKNTYLGNKWST